MTVLQDGRCWFSQPEECAIFKFHTISDTTTPFGKVVFGVCFDNEGIELLELVGSTTRLTDRTSSIGLSHDRLTMIL